MRLLLCAADARVSRIFPGLDFETKLTFKPEVAELLEKELRKPGYTARTLALGSNTDRITGGATLKLTRSVLQVLDRYNHPVGIVTKSAGVLRDLDILASMAKRRLARVYVSVTTLDAAWPGAWSRGATPDRRLHAIAELTRAGVPAGVLVAPMIPGLNDAEMEKIVEAAARSGARHAGYVLLRLPHELRQMFEDWLATHFPDRAKHVLNLIRETRGGALSDARFHHRFSGQGVYADLLLRRFSRATRRWGWTRRGRGWIAGGSLCRTMAGEVDRGTDVVVLRACIIAGVASCERLCISWTEADNLHPPVPRIERLGRVKKLERTKSLRFYWRDLNTTVSEKVAHRFGTHCGQSDIVGEIATQISVTVDLVRYAMQTWIVQGDRKVVQRRYRVRSYTERIEIEVNGQKYSTVRVNRAAADDGAEGPEQPQAETWGMATAGIRPAAPEAQTSPGTLI